MSDSDKPIVFISYSHKDIKKEENLQDSWLKVLMTPLEFLSKQGWFKIWEDGCIGAGNPWSKEIEDAISKARVAVLLVSDNYLNSDFIQDYEVNPFQKRQGEGRLHIYPVIIETCQWKRVAWLKEIDLRPKGKDKKGNNRSLRSCQGEERKLAAQEIVNEILELVFPPTEPDTPRKSTSAIKEKICADNEEPKPRRGPESAEEKESHVDNEKLKNRQRRRKKPPLPPAPPMDTKSRDDMTPAGRSEESTLDRALDSLKWIIEGFQFFPEDKFRPELEKIYISHLKEILERDGPPGKGWPRDALFACKVFLNTQGVADRPFQEGFKSLLESLLESYAKRLHPRIPAVFLRHVEGIYARAQKHPNYEKAVYYVLLDALKKKNLKIAQAAASIIGRIGLSSKLVDGGLGMAIVEALPCDGAELNWPIQSMLQRFVSARDLREACKPMSIDAEQAQKLLDISTRQAIGALGLKFQRSTASNSESENGNPSLWYKSGSLRHILRNDPDVVTFLTSDQAWLRLILTLYGGVADFGVLDLKRQLSSPLRLTRERAADSDALVLPRYRKLRERAPEFSIDCIFRESPLTKIIEDALKSRQSPECLREDLSNMVKLENPPQRIEALLGLFALVEAPFGYDEVLAPELKTELCQRLSSLTASLADGIARGGKVVLRILRRHANRLTPDKHSENPDEQDQEFEDTNTLTPNMLSDALDSVLRVSISAAGEAIDTFELFITSAKQDRIWRTKLLTEYWAFALNGDIRENIAALAARLDQFGDDFTNDGIVFLQSLARLPSAVNLGASDSLDDLATDTPVCWANNEEMVRRALRAVNRIPEKFRFFQKWALEWIMESLSKTDVEPEAIQEEIQKIHAGKFNWMPPDIVSDVETCHHSMEASLADAHKAMELRQEEIISWVIFRLAARAQDFIRKLTTAHRDELIELPGSFARKVALVSSTGHEEKNHQRSHDFLGKASSGDLLDWLSRPERPTFALNAACLEKLEQLAREGHTKNVRLILCYLEERLTDDARSLARKWLFHADTDERLRQYAALWLAESGEWSPKGLDKLIDLYKGPDCHGRCRVALLFYGASGEFDLLRASRLGQDTIEAMHQNEAMQRKNGTGMHSGMATWIRWLFQRLEFDQDEVSNLTSKLSEQTEEAIIEPNALGRIYRITPAAWQFLSKFLAPDANPVVQRAVLQSMIQIAVEQWGWGLEPWPEDEVKQVRMLLSSPDPKTQKQAVLTLGFLGFAIEDVDALRKNVRQNRCVQESFRAIGRIIQRNIEWAKTKEAKRCKRWLRDKLKHLDRGRKLSAAEALVRTGDEFRNYDLDSEIILEAHVCAAVELFRGHYYEKIIERGCKFLVDQTKDDSTALLKFALSRVQASSDETPEWLAITAKFAEERPKIFRDTCSEMEESQAENFRDCLYREAQENRSFTGREAALKLIGHLRRVSGNVLKVLSSALHDVPQVQQTVLNAVESLDRPSASLDSCLESLDDMLKDDDSMVAFLATRSLLTLARGDAAEGSQRARIRDDIEKKLRHAADKPPRPVYRLIGNGSIFDPYCLQYEGSLPELCRRALFELQEGVDGRSTDSPVAQAEPVNIKSDKERLEVPLIASKVAESDDIKSDKERLEVVVPDLPDISRPLRFQRLVMHELAQTGKFLDYLDYLSSSAALGNYSLHDLLEIVTQEETT